MGHQLKHGSNHIDGSDQIPDATTGSPGLMTAQHVVDLQNATTTSWLRPVLSSLDTPPVTPAAGERYRIIATAQGAWLGLEDQIAEWDGATWIFTIPAAGDVVADINADDLLRYSGSAWLDAGYDAAEIKTLYESNADTNAFTDAEQTKVGHIAVTQAVDLDTIETDTGLNNVHRSGDGSDHANVALNDTHRASDGTDHANVVLNDAHRAGDGSDHADVASNTADIAAAVTDTGAGVGNAGKLVELDGSGLLDGRDVGADGTKLDTIESGAEQNNISDVNATDLTDGGETSLHSHDTEGVNFSAAHDHINTLQDVINHVWSPGACASGFGLTDNGNGTVDIAIGSVVIRSTDSAHGELRGFSVPAAPAVALTDKVTNYIMVDYNGGGPGVPQLFATTDLQGDVLGDRTKVLVYAINRLGTDLYVVDIRSNNVDYSYKNSVKDYLVHRFEYAGGSEVVSLPSLEFSVSAGTYYILNNKYTAPALDTSALDTFEYIYEDGLGDWTRVPGATAIDNANYDDGSGTLAPVGNNKFTVTYLYAVINTPSVYKAVYGTAQYDNLAQAQAVGKPSNLPSDLDQFSTAVLVAKIIVQQGVTTFSDVQSPHEDKLVSETAPTHNLVGSLHTVQAPTTVTPDATPGTTNIDWGNGPIQILDLVNATGTETLTFSNMQRGHTYRLFVQQHPTTPQNITLPANALVAGGTAPTTLTLSVGASAIDEIIMFYDGTDVYVEDFRQNYG